MLRGRRRGRRWSLALGRAPRALGREFARSGGVGGKLYTKSASSACTLRTIELCRVRQPTVDLLLEELADAVEVSRLAAGFDGERIEGQRLPGLRGA